MNPVIHFEMPYDNPDRVAKFYRSAFGWQMQSLGKDMGDYVLASTTESDPTGRPKKPGTINGGFFPKKPDWPAQHPSVVIAVDDVRKAMGKVTAAGGTVLGQPMDIPGVGQYVSFTDPEGNRVCLLQPTMPKPPARPARATSRKQKPATSRAAKPARTRSRGGSTRRAK